MFDNDKIALLNDISNAIKSNDDLIGDESYFFIKDNGILTTDEIQREIERRKDSSRLLNIGIIGRVKAGKSTLLNGLFFGGQDILPKAATPMTAALTILNYGEKISATVDYFTNEDIDKIKEEHDKYLEKLEKLRSEEEIRLKKQLEERGEKYSILDLREKAERSAKRRMSEYEDLCSSYEHYSKIKESKINFKDLQCNTIKANTYEELSQKLKNYVGADGQFTPYTKSVTITLPIKSLENIQVVDTPGIDDPVQSREERTKELLKSCEVVFVVSPTGQFITQKDLDLMDRISSKQGIREIYLIASQVDHALFSSEKVENDLNKTLERISEKLNNHTVSIFKNLKEKSPEVLDTFDDLIENDEEKVILSSGVCYSLAQYFNQKDKWDENQKVVWNNLKTHFPFYFDENDEEISKASLRLIANIDTIKQKIDTVRNRKDEILNRSIDEFFTSQLNAYRTLIDNIIEFLISKKTSILKTDLPVIEAEKARILEFRTKKVIINDEYSYAITNIKDDILGDINSEIDSLYSDARDKVVNAEDTITKTKTVKVKQEGFWGGAKRFFGSLFGTDWGYDYEEREYTYTAVRANAVRNSIERFLDAIENSLQETINMRIKNSKFEIQKKLTQFIRNTISEDVIDDRDLRVAFKKIFESIQYIDNKEYSIPSYLKRSGTLTGSDAEEFLEDAKDYLKSVRQDIKRRLKKFFDNFTKSLFAINFGDLLFKNLDDILKQKEDESKNKNLYLERYEKLINEFKIYNDRLTNLS